MKVFPDEFNKLYAELSNNSLPIYNLNRDEFWKWTRETMKTKTVLYRQLAYMIYLKYNPFDEFKFMLSYTYQNMKILTYPLYRCEYVDRFTESDLIPGKTISWTNLIPATEFKEYALMYINDAAGASFNQSNKPKINILFIFKNIRAAHLHDYCSSYTTYTSNYNASHPTDTNRLNCHHPCTVVISSEYMLEPFIEYKITNVTTTIIDEPTNSANAPKPGKKLTIKVVELTP